MKILTYTSLYPNDVDPTHGIFVERRLAILSASSGIDPVVVAPVPWFPFRSRAFGTYAAMARIAAHERRNGIVVHHPRYPLLPKVGMSCAPYLMAAATRHVVRRAMAEHGPIGLIDAHYFYPDGVAAAFLAESLGIPLIVTARGSDINVIGQYRWPRRLMLRAAAIACAVVAVSRALADAMAELGVPRDRIHVLRNGVDLDYFTPGESPGGTATTDRREPHFLSVGALKRAKGHDVAIRFIGNTDAGRLSIVGGGPDEARLKRLCEELGVAQRVRFLGPVSPTVLRECYRSADALVLMSEREGMPNVVLESLACGTPVLASNVGGIAEILDDDVSGALVEPRDEHALAAAWARLRSRGIDRPAVRKRAERLSWSDTIARLERLVRDCACNYEKG